MLPSEHGENFCSPWSATGLMMNCALASQELPEKGQHCAELVPVAQPSAHYIMPPSVSFLGFDTLNSRRAVKTNIRKKNKKGEACV